MLDALNPQQREAVEITEGALLVVAGAGSGKTRVLTTRIAHLVLDHGVDPRSILAFTFTNKAAREMRERVARLAPGFASQAWIGTFHATGARILRREAHRLGYPNEFTIYDADDSRSLLNEILKSHHADPKSFTPRAVAAEISRFKNNSQTPEGLREQAEHSRDLKLADIYADYLRRLRQNGAMDFDDLIALCVQLLEQDPELRRRYGDRFRYVLVDEFQDTNPLQLILIKALSSTWGNVFAVGDDDQAIYSWRSATVENMLEFDDYFSGSRLLRLEQNYRSTSLILRAANGLIAHNTRRKGKTLWSERSGGDPIQLRWTDDGDDEGGRIRDDILEMLGENEYRRRDFAILYRTNAQSRALEDALRREGIPYQIAGGTRFFERREVRDVLAYCKLLVNPDDGVNLARVLNVPRRGIGKTSAERLLGAAAAAGVSPLKLCADAPRLAQICGVPAAKKLAQFAKLIFALQKLAHSEDAAKVLKQVLAATRYNEWLERDDPATAAERQENVGELVNAAHLFVEQSDVETMGAFVESVALLSDVDRLADEDDMVTLMTVHNAKGLEFPVVFLTGCEEGLLPHANSIGEDCAVEEERRLFYVALTRAKDRLFLSAASVRQRFGRYESMLPSRFLRELPADCIHEVGIPRERVHEGLHAGARVRTRPSASAPLDLGEFGVETFRRSRVHQQAKGHGFSPQELNQEEIHFAPGMHVRHELLGDGVVEKVEGIAELTRLTIRFGDAGTKKILARHARLTVLDAMD